MSLNRHGILGVPLAAANREQLGARAGAAASELLDSTSWDRPGT